MPKKIMVSSTGRSRSGEKTNKQETRATESKISGSRARNCMEKGV